MYPFIVADIGGTNARFALVTDKDGDQFKIQHINILQGADFERFEDAMATYIGSLNGAQVQSACVAIAAPVSGDQVTMTNLPWSFSQKSVCEQFALRDFFAINDYTALAIATSRLDAFGIVSIVPGVRKPKGNKAIFGPGSGLGVAGLAHTGDFWLPITSEGGHANIPPASDFECEIIKVAMHQHEHVSAETFLSGSGFVNLYKAIAEVNGANAKAFEPAQITHKAINNTDPLCRQTMDVFCSFLGTVAGDLALTYGAQGGVYITGGIVPRFIDYVKQSQFEERFRSKGEMSHYIKDIPVDVVTYEQTAFLGAATWLDQHTASPS